MVSKIRVYIFVGVHICQRNFHCVFFLVTKNVKVGQILPFCQMSAILKSNFRNRKQLPFSEANYLNYTKKTQFCM